MAVLHIVCKILRIYLFISLLISVYDVCLTFYNVIRNLKNGTHNEPRIFHVKEYIFCPSILFYSWIFSLIDLFTKWVKSHYGLPEDYYDFYDVDDYEEDDDYEE